MNDPKSPKKKPTRMEPFSHLDLDTVNASSSMDCTGLIPAAPNSYDEREAFQELYDYEAGIMEEDEQ